VCDRVCVFLFQITPITPLLFHQQQSTIREEESAPNEEQNEIKDIKGKEKEKKQ